MDSDFTARKFKNLEICDGGRDGSNCRNLGVVISRIETNKVKLQVGKSTDGMQIVRADQTQRAKEKLLPVIAKKNSIVLKLRTARKRMKAELGRCDNRNHEFYSVAQNQKVLIWPPKTGPFEMLGLGS